MKEANLVYAKEAIAYVRSKLKYGSNTEKDSKLPFWQPNRRKLLKEEVDRLYAFSKIDPKDFLALAQIYETALTKYGYGHCGELAIVAFLYLHRKGVTHLSFCVSTQGKHNLVVIGHEEGSDPKNISTWGENAVICDPWAEKAYLLSEFEEMQQPENDVKYPELCYKSNPPPPPYLAGTLKIKYRKKLGSNPTSVSTLSIFNESLPEKSPFIKVNEYESEINLCCPII